ncbi:MAG: ATP-binding protein [Rhodospirillales bacterium]
MIGRLLPATLVGRTALVLIAAVVVSNLVGLLVYTGDRFDLVTSARGRELAERIAGAVQVLDQADADERRSLVRAMRQPGLRLFWSQQPVAAADAHGLAVGLMRTALLDELGAEWGDRLRLTMGPFPPPGPRRGPPGPFAAGGGAATRPGVHTGLDPTAGPPAGDGGGWPEPPDPPFVQGGGDRLGLEGPSGRRPVDEAFYGSVRLADATWLNFIAAATAFRPFWTTPFFFIVVGTTVAVALVSFWAVRRAARPLSMFADAAVRLGRDVDAPPLDPEGPREVERAARAFNGMQAKLQALLRDRLQMLAAMSHDLRTPLTRLRLRAELIDDGEQQAKTLADLAEIEAMVEATLAYARNAAVEEKDTAFDLAVLLQTVCEEAEDTGGPARYAGPARLPWYGRPRLLKRALANLVDNAVKYGERAEVALSADSDRIEIVCDDYGPGIPAEERQRVFEPFYRSEGSRGRATGGVGLGLAVVRAAVEASHGGIELGNRPQGGLRVTLRLPRRRGAA